MKKLTTEEFITRAISIHGNKYDYSYTCYVKSCINVKIVCQEHGEFSQTPNNHLRGQDCPKCTPQKISKSKIKETSTSIISKFVNVHGNLYDYSLVHYVNQKQHVKIICKTHGEFEQEPYRHLKGMGCCKCVHINMSTQKIINNTSSVIDRCVGVHGNTYDYTNSKYVGYKRKMNIICHIHGEFEQTPDSHLSGAGCPKCSMSKGERNISQWLSDHNIEYIQEKRFDECKHKYRLPFDFYIPSLDMCIEYDGEQHFIPIAYFGGDKVLEETQLRDSIKTQFCLDNEITLVRIPYTEFDNIEHILKEKLK